MKTRKSLALWRTALVLALMAAAVAFMWKTPALEAQGRPDLEALHQRLLPLFETPGVVFTDADETRGRLVVGVLDRRSEGQVRGRLRALGVDSQSVDVVETEPIIALATLRDRSSSLAGGLQIRFSQFLCSLGFPAFDGDGTAGFVTASHCSDSQGAVDGTTYYQPLNQVDEDLIGTEIADPPYVRNGRSCPKGRKCRQSDANFSRSLGPRPVAVGIVGKIARTTGLGSLDINSSSPTFTITAEGEAHVGDAANKVGRTTGWTRGTVSNTCVNTGVSGSTIVLLCQTFVTAGGVIVQGGDSGSPVFGDPSGGNVTLLGGLWGGNQSGTQFVYSPIANIRNELGNLTTH
jgi:hypothetical protein